MDKLPFNKILALSPHTDDIEFGCGGTIHRLIQQGAKICTAVFSLCEESVPKGYPKDILLKEMYQAAVKLNIPKDNIAVYSYPVRRFPEHRQDILEDLVKLNRKLKPDLVLTSSSFDRHQDHQVMCQESIRAFRDQTILAYELPWNSPEFHAQALISLKRKNLDAKLDAIKCYQSQEFRHFSEPDFFLNLATLRGLLNRSELAEAFEVIRLSL